MKNTVFIVLILIASLITGCSQKQTQTNVKIVTVEKKIITTHLYYNGVVDPLYYKSVTSPVDGIVKELNFEYGQTVQKGSLLLSLYSRQLQDTYRNTLTTYLTAKRTYLDSLASFEGTKALYKNKIASDEEFNNEQSRVDSNRLAYINALYNLEQALKDIPGEKIPEFKENIERLSFQEMSRIEEILDRKMDIIKIYAAESGVALLSKKEEGEAEGQEKEIYEGASIKKGENLLSLGNLNGITVLIKISELDINRVRPGQHVELSIPALPGEILKGEIKSISAQARIDTRTGGGAVFPAKIIIKEISDKQRQLLRIGMSVKVSVTIQSQPELIIPIEAVFDQAGVDMVIMLDSKTKKEKNVRIVVGKTNPEGISVLNGLKEGDKVLVRH